MATNARLVMMAETFFLYATSPLQTFRQSQSPGRYVVLGPFSAPSHDRMDAFHKKVDVDSVKMSLKP